MADQGTLGRSQLKRVHFLTEMLNSLVRHLVKILVVDRSLN